MSALISIFSDLVACTVIAFFWVLNKIQLVWASQIGAREAVLSALCLTTGNNVVARVLQLFKTFYVENTKDDKLNEDDDDSDLGDEKYDEYF